MKTGMQSLSRFFDRRGSPSSISCVALGWTCADSLDAPSVSIPLIDEPHFNKAKVKENSKLQATWKCNWVAVDNFLKGDGPPPFQQHGVKNVTGLTTPVMVVDLATAGEEEEEEEEEEGGEGGGGGGGWGPRGALRGEIAFQKGQD